MMGHGGGAWMMMRRGGELEKGYKLKRGTIPRALKLAAKYRAAIIGLLTVTVLSAMIGVIPPLLLKQLLDKAIAPKFPELAGTAAHRMQIVVWVAVAGVIVALLSAGIGLAQRYLSSHVGEGLIFDLRVKLFDHVQRMPLAFFTRTQTGALISRLNSDVIGAQSAMTGTLQTIVSNVITLSATLVAMVALNWEITLLAMIVLPAFLLPTRRVGKRLQALTRDQMNLNSQMMGTMQERFNVSGAMLAKLFGHPKRDTAMFSERAGRVRDMGVRIAVYSRVFFLTLGLVAAMGTAVVFWLGGRFAVEGVLTVGTVVALISYVGNLYQPLLMLTNSRVDLMTSFVSFERVFEVLDLPPAIDDAPDAMQMPGTVRGEIEFKDVRFRYPRAQDVSLASLETAGNFDEETAPTEVLHGVSFSARAGETIALVGPSGAGKTTISNLIPRLYDVAVGAVTIDGIDVRTVTQESLRAHIGVVSQDPHLFHDTIANNLRYTRPEATDTELVEACKAAQIFALIASLPDGFETVVGERGYRLSGGEKQRVAIARLLLKQPEIMILDEATSHLDSESEVLIQRALDHALANRTAVVIAHRLSTVVNADRILVVDDGAIVQQGSHDELVGVPGLYADLYHTQFARALVE